MSRRFLSQLFALVRLRYKLIWAQARTTSGRMAMLFVIYLILLLVGLFLVLGGAATAVAGIRSGEGETIARGTLTGLMVSAIITSLVFGVGPRTAFADEVLRRYPLNAFERNAARHFVGIIDPIWFLLSASAVGLAVGLALLDAGSLVWGLPAALLYIAICYLTTVFLLSLLDRFLRTPTGAAIVGGIALMGFSFSGLAMTWLIEHRQDVWIGKVNEALRWFPSGLAASSMISADMGETIINFIALIAWGLLLLLLTRWSERRPAVRRSNSRGAIDWDNFYDRFAALFGRRYAPLMGKALRYNLRSNRVRFGLATTPLFVFVGQFIPPMDSIGMAASEFYVTLAVFAFLGFSWPSAVTINQFGADGAGMRRYGLLPAPFAAAARAGSLAAVMLGALVIPPTIMLWAMVTPVEVEWRMIAMLLGNSLTGLLIFNALGLWTTILSPRRIDFTSLLGNQSALGGNLVIIGGMFVIYASLFALLQLRMPLEAVLDYWWVAWAFAFAGLLFYLFTWKVIGRVADACRDRLVKTIAG
jgi:hypothetical protein